jgi:hypothetical protein
VLRRGQGLPPLSPHPFLRERILPPLRSGQVSLDEAEHFLHNRDASVATLRWCSGSSRNAVRLPFGMSVQLHRNPQTGFVSQKPQSGTKTSVKVEAGTNGFVSQNVPSASQTHAPADVAANGFASQKQPFGIQTPAQPANRANGSVSQNAPSTPPKAASNTNPKQALTKSDRIYIMKYDSLRDHRISSTRSRNRMFAGRSKRIQQLRKAA